jgi:hypothetical protein
MAGKNFTHYIAQAKWQELAEKLNHANFLQLLQEDTHTEATAAAVNLCWRRSILSSRVNILGKYIGCKHRQQKHRNAKYLWL